MDFLNLAPVLSEIGRANLNTAIFRSSEYGCASLNSTIFGCRRVVAIALILLTVLIGLSSTPTCGYLFLSCLHLIDLDDF